MKKIYEVKGMMEWHPEFRVGRVCLKVAFTGGHLCGGACTPAVCETTDPVVQKVIESSTAFRNGRIRLVKEQQLMEGRLPSLPPDVPGSLPPKKLVSIEFDDIDKATDFLQHAKGIPLERIITLDQCVAEAKRLGMDLKIKK